MIDSKLAVLVLTHIEKALSRKFIAWIAATVAMFLGKVDGDAWMVVTGIYMGLQTGLDYRAALLGKGANVIPPQEIPTQK